MAMVRGFGLLGVAWCLVACGGGEGPAGSAAPAPTAAEELPSAEPVARPVTVLAAPAAAVPSAPSDPSGAPAQPTVAPAAPESPAEDLAPAKSVKAVKPVKPAKSVKSVKPVKPVKPATADEVDEVGEAPAAKARSAAEAAAVAEPMPPQRPALFEGVCGDKGQPACPLQGWMERKLQAPFDAEDLAAVARGLRQSKQLVPAPGWNAGDKGWAGFAEAGVRAAEAGDLAGTKQSCKGCHRAFRKRYKAEYRKRLL